MGTTGMAVPFLGPDRRWVVAVAVHASVMVIVVVVDLIAACSGAAATWQIRAVRSRVGSRRIASLNGSQRLLAIALIRRFANYRIRALLYAGKPNWDLLATIAPR